MDNEETIRPLDEDEEPKYIRLARKWLAFPEDMRKQVQNWELIDAMAREDLESFCEEWHPIETHERKPAATPIGMRFDPRRFPVKAKSVRAETVPANEWL